MADDTLISTLTDSQAAQALPVTQPQIPQQAPDLPRFQRTFGNTLKSMLIGLGEGGVLGAAVGGINPAAIERQQQQRQQVMSLQTAEAVAKAHVAQINAAALPGKLRDEHDKAVDEHVKFMTDIYGPPNEVIPNTSEAAQAALQNHLGNGNVPLAHIASNSDSIFAWHAGAASANSANLDIVHQAGILSGNPAFRNMTFQQYGALKPDEREQLFVKAGGILSPVTPDPDPVARARQLLDAQRQLQTVQSLPGGRQKDQLLTLAQNNMDFLNKADKAYADAGITSARQKGQQAGVEAIEAQPGKTRAQISGETAETATPKGQLATQKTKSEIAEANARATEARANAQKALSEAGLGGLKPADPVIGFDASGSQIMTNAKDAAALNLHDQMKPDAAMVEKVGIARSYIALNNQLLADIDQLDKAGKLGIAASRWNEFITNKVGTGDPDFEKFRVDLGLANTALMQFHVGNRGGSQMLEHFQDLANGKKMDANTLRAGIQAEGDYARHRAMLTPALAGQLANETLRPTQQNIPGGKTTLSEGQTGKGSDGKRYVVKGGAWQPAQ